ncbi:MAG: SDR family NAD(P)-dependent oxidoreductase [Alphaproteobacteria bacterium]|nr:SDR family NAD(P)-dependent oxidoreductase [Alphaproteobacteria bacterium]
MLELTNKTIFITGATSGFGRSLAMLAASRGAQVVATGRREDRLAELKSHSHHIHTIALDVRDKTAVEKAVASLPADYANVDVLVNNAGLAMGFDSFEKQSPEGNQQMVDTNISGLLHATHALLPGMIARDRGHIVNISSIAGSYPYPGGNVYGATKAFVTQFSLNLRADLLGRNIRVTSIEPGMCDTEFSLVRFAGDKSKADAVYDGMQPLSSDDIANTIFWCITQPAHVNVNRLEVMPVMQAFSPFAVARK